MKAAGYILFTLGVMTAISAGAKLPPSAEGMAYPDTWPICLLGVFCGAAGVVLWRWGLRREEQERRSKTAREPHAHRHADPGQLLTGTVKAAGLLQSEIEALEGNSLLEALDALLEQHLLPLAEVRQRVLDHFGMSTGAEILVALAVGERMVNRAWSAAADGYRSEARRSYHEAVQAIQHADQLWKDAEKARSVA